MKRKIVSIVGARPNFIKIAPISLQLKGKCVHKILHTGQHYDDDMSKVFFKELRIPKPDINLNVGSGSDSEVIAKMLIGIDRFLTQERPDFVIVYGDTNSTLAGALASAKQNIPIAHIEAGARCGNKEVPEEINRIIVDHISKLCLAPTKECLQNLKSENVSNSFFTGDLMIDAIRWLKEDPKILSKYKLRSKEYVYASFHRAYNTDDSKRLKTIFSATNNLGFKVVIPMHPRTQKEFKKLGLNEVNFNNIIFLKPISYFQSLTLIKNAKLVISDSGGIQKESYWFKIPCFNVRNETEHPELVKSGWNILVKPEQIKSSVEEFIKKQTQYKKQIRFFGDGNAASTISRILFKYI